MHQSNEAKAVSAAASFIATAILILQHSGESIGIGIRTEAERSLQRLGPDHKVTPLSREALRGYLAEQFGEDFVVDVVDNNAPQPREAQTDLDKRFNELEARMQKRGDELEKRGDELEQENARLRAELEAKQKPAGKKDEPAKDKEEPKVPQPGGSGRANS